MRIVIGTLLMATILAFGSQGTIQVVSLAGREQKLHLYGPENGPPVILASGDGGWIHVAPHLADILAARGYFVMGLDSRSYLNSGSGTKDVLTPTEIARDYRTLLSKAGTGTRVLLVGVSEGAGLSVVAAADPRNQDRIAGVIAIGLGDRNELAWHWKDSIIYVTKGVPSEPIFNASTFLPHVSPVPLAFIRSTHDEFVPRTESDHLIAAASSPVHSWIVSAGDHRFSDNLPELDRATLQAFDWIFAVHR
jgi:pimeloyl-ACP methyl ester carboxylesterase